MEPLKDQFFNTTFFNTLTDLTKEIYPQLNSDLFRTQLADKLESKELMQRLEHTSTTLKEHLPSNYIDALEIIEQLAPKVSGFAGMTFPNFVQRYGLSEFDRSLESLKLLTRYSSSEFAIRVFLKEDFNKTLKVMEKWANDDNVHVRRLASEGSRPRLPWSFKLDRVISDPTTTKNILDCLSADPELYVKKSVGNHLNDIAKDHPEYALDRFEELDQTNKHSNWILKRGIRTLVKDGHPRTFGILGFEKSPQLAISEITLSAPTLKLGEAINFKFKIDSENHNDQKINIDYAIHYVKKNGDLSPKVFKLKELVIPGMGSETITKKHRFENFTTRQHHAGIHKIELLINGKPSRTTSFELKLDE